MDVRIKWVDGMMFLGESESGHAVVMDGPPEIGGNNMGVRPMEMLLLGDGRVYFCGCHADSAKRPAKYHRLCRRDFSRTGRDDPESI
ncbi:[similarity to] OsmC/Ohr family protein [methanotrophic bacterial endosymbiont of Bathymodiolus sp.]|nr:[similarity to] OsmC/Ohr family protein [methanotrophic bacterial endosymbiont of Bathymodiolus sp.]